jgi:hypothetical protein
MPCNLTCAIQETIAACRTDREKREVRRQGVAKRQAEEAEAAAAAGQGECMVYIVE